jgi:hypothetical protein
MFTEDQIRQIEDLRFEIEMNQLPIDKQEAKECKGFYWCSDWWHIEVCRCLIVGHLKYLESIVPERGVNNPIWGASQAVTAVDYKLKMVEALTKVKDFSDTIFICEVGRGVDLLLASFVKQWKKVICYDINPFVLEKFSGYFRNEFPVESFPANTGDYDFSKVGEKVILIANHCRLGKNNIDAIKANSNILAIIDGEVVRN